MYKLKLKELMRVTGISIRALSIKSGVSRAYISDLINGEYDNPSILIIVSLCNSLGCKLNDLIEVGEGAL